MIQASVDGLGNLPRLVQPYVDGLVPKTGGVYHVDEMLLHVRKENNEQTMNDNEENHTHKFFDNQLFMAMESHGFDNAVLDML